MTPRILAALACYAILSASAGTPTQTYWLSRIETPERVSKNGPYPIVSDPRDAGYLTAITIENDVVLMNGADGCGARIDYTRDFYIDRTLAEAIDDAGGIKKFNAFVERKLKTTITAWKQKLELKEPLTKNDSDVCQLLARTSIYKGLKEIVLWDTLYFYKFDLGADYKGAFRK
ncbi:hypothetical protein [Aquabacterium olei]|uniref:hypothetical protein n=1 Tax=Aquabacterium olei TaxID=1296669 RepID=UPI00131F1452|nr:hypothetical protein [Aquabacterium olei]